ncbi:hypothetical protein KIN20_027828 [Parelaphostrongylus tenuis]|uniref:Apple domain-containing protein n=1 Tax=Parelaphostrongylus tenuis TaxID=148309 RepID=A0AAD5R064_PARTN|nr:hypothetical protein KIN20_027828 [Parelaphostrongylus tenuis]
MKGLEGVNCTNIQCQNRCDIMRSQYRITANKNYIGRCRNSLKLKPNVEEYFEKYCLEAPFTCLDATFEQVPGRTMNSRPHREFDTSSVNSCLAACLADGASCISTVFDYEKKAISILEPSQLSEGEKPKQKILKTRISITYKIFLCKVLILVRKRFTLKCNQFHRMLSYACPGRIRADAQSVIDISN